MTYPTEPIKIGLRENQQAVFNSRARFKVVVAGRRFGKTYLALAEMLRAAACKDRVVWYVAPTRVQAKQIAWRRLKKLTREFWAGTPSETELRINLTFGSTIALNGADNPDSMRGTGLDFAVLDEFASMHAEAWTEVLRPALSERHGKALFIGTPKGRNHFYDHFEFAKTDPEWEAFQFTTAQGGLVDSDELGSAARQLDRESYRQEFEGEFTSVGRNRVYYGFERAMHVQPVTFEPGYPLAWAIDFNVNPMCMLLMQRQGEIVNVFDEIVIQPDANTEKACQVFLERAMEIYQKLGARHRPLEVNVYGDAGGNQRRTSASATDWVLIQQFFNVWKGTFVANVQHVSVNPAVRDRVNCVNSRLRNSADEVRIFIDPRCRELIRDLEQVTWAVDAYGATTSDIEKSDRLRTHASDALGYFIAKVFPLQLPGGYQNAGRLL